MILLKYLGLLESNLFFELFINFKHSVHNSFPLLICLTNHFFLINTKVKFNTRNFQNMAIYMQVYLILWHFAFLCIADIAVFFFFFYKLFVATLFWASL